MESPTIIEGLFMKKYGTGHIIPEDDDNQKVAKENWTEKDEKELEEENKDA
jgi:hypothetical protein